MGSRGLNSPPSFLSLSLSLGAVASTSPPAFSESRRREEGIKSCLRGGEGSCRQGFRWILSHRIGAIFSPLGHYRCETTGRSHFPSSSYPRVWRALKPLPPTGQQDGQKGRSGCVLRGPQRAEGDQQLLRAGEAECPSLIPDHYESCHQDLIPVSTQSLTKMLLLLGSHSQFSLCLSRS